MARIRNIVMEGATGRLGSMVLTQRAGTGTVARTLAPEVTNPKSEAQQARRVKWGNLVNFYKVSKGWMAKAYENKASNQSDYNKFMSLNANTTLVALTKDEANQGGVIAGPYTISQGSLPSVEITRLVSGAYATNIALGQLTISESTTVADFTAAVLANNSQLRSGMQISFISYQQQTNNVTNVPYVICGWYEVTLDANDPRTLNSVMPVSFAAATVENGRKVLGTGTSLNSGAFAYVISDRVGGKIRVSTQQLTVHNNDLYSYAISSAALSAAIDSYGRGASVFLAPGYTGDAQSQGSYNSIESLAIGDRTIIPGVTIVTMQDLAGSAKLSIIMQNALGSADVDSVRVSWHPSSSADARESTTVTTSGTLITVNGWNPSMSLTSDPKVKNITVVMADGTEYVVSFPESTIID